jgi:hypothetical protein
MAGTLYGFPFDEDLFLYRWRTHPDPVLSALLKSGAMVNDSEIARLIANGSNQYTIPYYNNLTGDELNYDGNTDLAATPTTGDSLTGVVWGRMMAWEKRDFTADFNSGADPMEQIVSQVANYFNKKRQSRLVKILNAIFGISGDADWSLHTLDISTKSESVTDANKINPIAANDAMQKALGDKKGDFALVVMHSYVANKLEGLNLLDFWKYTDASGIQRKLTIADYNGLTVIVDDGVPVTDSASASGAKEYTTYLLGRGVIRYAEAPLRDNLPVEVFRDPHKKGGVEELICRYRETMHPWGFSFNLSDSNVVNKTSPTDTDLSQSSAWTRKWHHKNLPIARLITNG